MILSTLADEEAFYAAIGWAYANATRPNPPAPPYSVPTSIGVHDGLENCVLLDMERMAQRTGSVRAVIIGRRVAVGRNGGNGRRLPHCREQRWRHAGLDRP